MMFSRLYSHFSIIMHGKLPLSLTRSTIPIIIGWSRPLMHPSSLSAAACILGEIISEPIWYWSRFAAYVFPSILDLTSNTIAYPPSLMTLIEL